MLRLATSAYLGRYTGTSRVHSESDLRLFLTWCTERDLAPLTVGRSQVELYVRWMQEVRRFTPSTVSRRTAVVTGFYRTCVTPRTEAGQDASVTVEHLDAGRVATLRAARLTYAEVGRTAGNLPRGYRTFTRTTRLPAAIDFETATHDLLHWQVHRRAGLRVAASSDQVTPEAVVVLGVGIGRVAVHAACRVVYIVDEPRRRGFAYGTLPGHPESGEEAFLLQQHDDGTVTFTIIAFSRPAGTLAKLAGPLNRRVQDAITDRYLRALAT